MGFNSPLQLKSEGVATNRLKAIIASFNHPIKTVADIFDVDSTTITRWANKLKKDFILIMDGAGWHKSKNLVIPKNIQIILLPPYCPELNPVKRLWRYIKGICDHNYNVLNLFNFPFLRKISFNITSFEIWKGSVIYYNFTELCIRFRSSNSITSCPANRYSFA